MAAKDNLIPVRSKEEASELGRKGGLASGKARRAAKVYADAAKAVLASRFKTACAGDDLREACKALGFGKTETAAVMLALSDFLRWLKDGDKESAERILSASGVSLDDTTQRANTFESPQIIVLPSAKPGENVDAAAEEADGESP